MWPAECSVLAYVLPGLPMEQTSNGYAVCTAFLARGICGGIEDPSGMRVRDFLGRLFGGLRGDSVSVSEGVGKAESCFCRFWRRRSLRLKAGVVNAIAESVSLVSGVVV
jgi:hypothetical protein